MLTRAKNRLYKALRWSEKYTKTDMVYLASGSFWLTLGQVTSSLLVLLLAVAFANLVPKEVFGTYRYILSVSEILTALTLTGLGTVIVQTISRGFEGLARKAFLTNLRWSTATIIVALGMSAYYFINNNNELSIALILVAVFSPILSSLNLFVSILNGKKKFREATIYWAVANTLSTLILIGSLFITQNVLIIFAVYIVSRIIFTGIFHFLTLKMNPLNKKNEPGAIKYAKHLSVINILTITATHIDKVLVFHYLGTVQLAIYLFAIAIPEQLKAFLKQIGTLALPNFSNRSFEKIQKTIGMKMLKLGALVFLTILIYIPLAPYIYQLLFPQYSDSIFFSQIFAISLIGVVNILPVTALQAHSQTKELYTLSIFSSVLQILSMFIGVIFYGIMGLVVSRVIVRITMIGVTYFMLKPKKT